MLTPIEFQAFAGSAAMIAACIQALNVRSLRDQPVAVQARIREDEADFRRRDAVWPLVCEPDWRPMDPAEAAAAPLAVFLNVHGLRRMAGGGQAARTEQIRAEIGARMFPLFCPGTAPLPARFSRDIWKRLPDDSDQPFDGEALKLLSDGFPRPFLVVDVEAFGTEAQVSIAYRGGGRETPVVRETAGGRFPFGSLAPGRAQTARRVMEMVDRVASKEEAAVLAANAAFRAARANGVVATVEGKLRAAGVPEKVLPPDRYAPTPTDHEHDAKALAAVAATIAGLVAETDRRCRLAKAACRDEWQQEVLADLPVDAQALAAATLAPALEKLRGGPLPERPLALQLQEKVVVDIADYMDKRKSTGLAILIWVVSGWFGGHRFYVGDRAVGLAILAFTIFSWVSFLAVLPHILWWLTMPFIMLVELCWLPGRVRMANKRLLRGV